MDRVQRNGGTFGILGGLALIVLFAAFAGSGLGPDVLPDPAKALPVIREKASLLRLIGLAGGLSVAFSLIFTAGLYARLRGSAPTRATAGLLFLVVGLIGHGLGSLLAGVALPAVASLTDQAAAAPAYLGVLGVDQAVDALGNAFTGAGDVLFGWAVIATGVLPSLLGWLFLISGVVGALVAFISTSEILFTLNIVLLIVSLLWGGAALRRAAA